MRKLLLLILGLNLISNIAGAQEFNDLSKQVPFDQEIRQGVLPNGITYYIRHNEMPKEKASFYIYQNVGAVLEKDEQDGLAHFLEHMAFNGTQTYPGNSMLDMLERNGVKFGKDINAYTTNNETVYNISRVPVKAPGLIDSCLIVLRDWCDGLALTEEEIDKERGVISEEWRTRRNTSFRIRKQIAPAIYNNSIYAERDVIGELDVIKNFDPKTLRKFYHDWYRTDLQAVAIVGDIDVDKIEKKVVELFSAIPAIENPKERVDVVIPDNPEPLYVLATDSEYKNVKISMTIRHAKKVDNTLEGLRQNYIYRFFNALMSNRYAELTQKGDAPFLAGKVGYSNFVRGYNSFKIEAKGRENEQAKTFEAVYTVFQQVLNHGFTQSELERLKTNMLVSAERKYTNQNKIGTESYCKSLKTAYLKNVSLPDAEFVYQFAKEIIPGITVEEVSTVAHELLTDKNRVYTVIGPKKKELGFLNKNEIEDIIEKVKNKEIEPYVDIVSDNVNLLSKEPIAGKIINEKRLEAFDAWEWTLSNGAKVVYRYANYSKESVGLKAISKGGSSLYDVEDLPSMGAVKSYVRGFGIGQYDPVAYKKMMTGKSAGSDFKIGAYIETVSGGANTKDIETMMQLVYMRFEEPRFDSEKFDNLKERNYYSLENKVETMADIMQDTVKTIIANGNPRAVKFTKEYVDGMDFERMKEIYKERISNASDFIFFIVGDVDAETLKPLVEKYIASIPGTGAKEEWLGRKSYFPKGKNEHRISLPMAEPKASVGIQMKSKAKYSRETVIHHTILKSILNLRYTKNIREKEGGTYGVSVRSGASLIPEMRLSLDIKFDCDPDKADYLKSLVYKELELVKHNVEQEELNKVVLNMQKSTANNRENNSYWMTALQTWYDTGENVLEPSYFEEVLENVRPKDIQKAADRFLKKADVLDIMFLPETK